MIKLLKNIEILKLILCFILISILPVQAEDTKKLNQSSEVIYLLLKSEIDDEKGYIRQANEALIKAALLSDDWKVARQAAYYSLRHKNFNDTQESALRWLQLASSNKYQNSQTSNARVFLSLSYIGNNLIEKAVQQLILAISENSNNAGESRHEIYQTFANELFYFEHLNRLSIYDYFLSELKALQKLSDEMYISRAILAYRLENTLQYEKSLKTAMLLNRKNTIAGKMLIEYYIESSQGRSQKTQLFLKNFIRSNPNSFDTKLLYSRYLLITNNNKQAKKQLQQVIEKGDDLLKSKASLVLGILAYQNNDLEKAKERVIYYLKNNSYSDSSWFLLCNIHHQQKEYQFAIDACQKISSQQLYLKAQFKIIDILDEQNQYEEAIQYLSELRDSELNNKNQIIMKQYYLMIKKEDVDRARIVLEQALIMDQSNTEILYTAGLWQAEYGKLQTAEYYFTKVIELDANNAQAYNAWGYTLVERTQEYQKALTLILKAYTLSPQSPYILDSLGWVYYKLKEYQKSLSYLELAYKLTSDAEIESHLLEVYKAMGLQDKIDQLISKELNIDQSAHNINQLLKH